MNYIPTLGDAKATVESAILSAFASNCHETGLVAGGPTERLVDSLLEEIFAPSTLWAVQKLAEHEGSGT